MADKARFAFGSSNSIEAAKIANKIDNYDFLLLDGDTDPKVGWIDGQGVTRIVQNKNQIVRVDALPTADGDENIVYIYNNEGYIWDGTQCVPLFKSADLTALEEEVAKKTDVATVETMIETAIADSSGIEVVEF